MCTLFTSLSASSPLLSPFFNALLSDVLVTCRYLSPLNLCRISSPQLYHPTLHYTLPFHSHILGPLHPYYIFFPMACVTNMSYMLLTCKKLTCYLHVLFLSCLHSLECKFHSIEVCCLS